ncbi:hypothetical protein EXN66_Car009832 [Channa argus]|uniref:Uncharacterized protein n=1 Tax=Channa argus TaxID=215402 RepID=A0A6G1PW01_CHAAH|nr:hypothetical protein EXN66_Car009832 [Channa argus]
MGCETRRPISKAFPVSLQGLIFHRYVVGEMIVCVCVELIQKKQFPQIAEMDSHCRKLATTCAQIGEYLINVDRDDAAEIRDQNGCRIVVCRHDYRYVDAPLVTQTINMNFMRVAFQHGVYY